ncbi:MAG: hypothetical protein R3Y24_08315 [Eubacteriales bacterium]
MKKKIVAALMVTALAMSSLVGCGGSDTSSTTATTETSEVAETTESAEVEETTEELPVLRVAVQPYFVSAQIGYIMDNGLDVENGFIIEPILFSNGMTINEALSTDSYDISPTGGAYVFAAAQFDAKVIGCHLNGGGGNEVWIKADSEMAAVTGTNADYPNILGSAETVAGSTILQTTGTTSQYVTTKWLDAIGADLSTVEMVNMEFAQVYNSFVADQGEVAGLVSPYCFQTDDTMVRAASLDDLGIKVYEETIIPNRVYEDESMTDVIVDFMTVLYQVGDIFEADPTVKFEAVSKWYTDNGSTATAEEIQAECDLKSYVTTADLKEMTYGTDEIDYATFMFEQDKIDETGLESFKANVVTDYIDAVLAGLE